VRQLNVLDGYPKSGGRGGSFCLGLLQRVDGGRVLATVGRLGR
jgi:hypothetical protein